VYLGELLDRNPKIRKVSTSAALEAEQILQLCNQDIESRWPAGAAW
jgi:hypothetical protein